MDPSNAPRQSNKRPGIRPSSVDFAQKLCLSSATPQRMSRSETSTRSRPNADSTSSRISHAGHDRRRARRIEARHAAPLGQRHRRRGGRAAPPGGCVRARGPRPAPGRTGRARGRSPRTTWRCRRPRRRRAARSRIAAGHGRLDRRRARPRPAPSSSARGAAGPSAGGARCGGRRRPAWRRGSPPRRAAPTTSSVEPPPMSITSSAVGSPGSRATVAPRNVSRASSSPDSVRASSP